MRARWARSGRWISVSTPRGGLLFPWPSQRAAHAGRTPGRSRDSSMETLAGFVASILPEGAHRRTGAHQVPVSVGAVHPPHRWPVLVCGDRRHRVHSDLTAVGVGPLADDRKSTRLKSSHVAISYAVFCLKKKKAKESNEEDPLERYQ